MSQPEVVFRIVDRAGNLHRVKAERMASGHDRVAVFYGAARSEVAHFVEPVAVTLDSAEMLDHRPLVQGEVCAALVQSSGGMSLPLIWLSAASWLALVALVALRAYDYFAFS